jgi:hypothetical protein
MRWDAGAVVALIGCSASSVRQHDMRVPSATVDELPLAATTAASCCREPTGRNNASYDNTALAMLTVFQAMTLSGWSFIMYRAMDATSPAAIAYFVLLVSGAVPCRAGLARRGSSPACRPRVCVPPHIKCTARGPQNCTHYAVRTCCFT